MKTAVVLFNLGGPDSPEAVQSFLFNLFYDRAIIDLPNPFRWLIAKLISIRRTAHAQAIYAKIGGKSPLLQETQAQADALQAALGTDHRMFIAMRYFHPFAQETVAQVKNWNPDRVVLLPLYPQYSTTTTGSSFENWRAESRKQKFDKPTRLVCCYPVNDDFIKAHSDKIREIYAQAAKRGTPRILFSAHGLPEKIIAKGDPYQWQVEQTVKAVVEQLAIPKLDYVTCYQSRVGPLKWIGPYTDEVIVQTAHEQKPILVVPIAFVSEHSETLVELDIDYRGLAAKEGAMGYFRVPALGVSPHFIAALAGLVRADFGKSLCSSSGKRVCPENRTLCPCLPESGDATL